MSSDEMSTQVTISKAEYDNLIQDQKFLRHLEANGVDNWEGYSHPDNEEDEDESA